MMDKLNEPAWWRLASFAAMALFFGWLVWSGFKTGRVTKSYAYEGTSQPKRFWLAMAFWIVGSLLCAYASISTLVTLTKH